MSFDICRYSVDVVIPSTDRIEGLMEAICSVIDQDFQGDIFIHLVENNSRVKDRVRDSVVEKLELPYGRFIQHTVLENCDNANVARNYGARNGCADFVAFLDSDDRWGPKFLSESIRTLVNSGGNGCYSGYKIHRSQASVSTRASRPIDRYEHGVNFLFSGGYAQTSSFVMVRSSFEAVLWDESFKRNQDYDFFIRFHEKYGWVFNDSVMVDVYWAYGVSRSHHLDSYSLFLKRYFDDMSFSTRHRYFIGLLVNYSRSCDSDYAKVREMYSKYVGFSARLVCFIFKKRSFFEFLVSLKEVFR